MATNTLDPYNIIKMVYNEELQAFNSTSAGGSLITEPFNAIELAYIAAGNGAGEIGTVVYKNGATTVATLTLSYDGSNRLVSISKA